MIVVDSSALIAILQHEPERERFFDLIAAMSTVLYPPSPLLRREWSPTDALKVRG
jgi:uncharacterized protein with PIN domain